MIVSKSVTNKVRYNFPFQKEKHSFEKRYECTDIDQLEFKCDGQSLIYYVQNSKAIWLDFEFPQGISQTAFNRKEGVICTFQLKFSVL